MWRGCGGGMWNGGMVEGVEVGESRCGGLYHNFTTY